MFGTETAELIKKAIKNRDAEEDRRVLKYLSEHFTQEKIIKDISTDGYSSCSINAKSEVLSRWFTENFDETIFTYSTPYSSLKIFLRVKEF